MTKHSQKENSVLFEGFFLDSKHPRKMHFLFRSTTFDFPFNGVRMIHLCYAYIWKTQPLVPPLTAVGTSQKTLAACCPSSNQTTWHLQLCQHAEKKLIECALLLLSCCSVSAVTTVCSIVGCQVTEKLSRPSILPVFNRVDSGAPTCGESGI